MTPYILGAGLLALCVLAALAVHGVVRVAADPDFPMWLRIAVAGVGVSLLVFTLGYAIEAEQAEGVTSCSSPS